MKVLYYPNASYNKERVIFLSRGFCHYDGKNLPSCRQSFVTARAKFCQHTNIFLAKQ